jgi:broad specificity phosphatase PhoE
MTPHAPVYRYRLHRARPYCLPRRVGSLLVLLLALPATPFAHLLKDARITRIYTSQWKRTKQTAAPLAQALDLPTTEIPDGDPEQTFASIRANDPKGIVLIVGHSNTIEPLLRQWSASATLDVGNQYDNLLVVIPTGDQASWVRFKYGEPTP